MLFWASPVLNKQMYISEISSAIRVVLLLLPRGSEDVLRSLHQKCLYSLAKNAFSIISHLQNHVSSKSYSVRYNIAAPAQIMFCQVSPVNLTLPYEIASSQLNYDCFRQINRNTGEVQKRNPRVLVKNSSGEIELLLQRPVCAELYSTSKELGKFLVRTPGIN